MQQDVAGGGTISTQYLHNICTRDVGKMFAKMCGYVGGMLRYNPALLSGLTHCSLFSVFANIQNLINIQHNAMASRDLWPKSGG